ncbi:CRISPR-associated protein Cmr3 [Betaproteobacteria bacterium]|nr:CRISPR-associated protein Cmr3 [Betaproteobacteria bacterium]
MNHTYLLDALAPLVFRSGKPFGSQAGADGGNFPLPSSLAGLVRTLHADQTGQGFSPKLREEISVAGPLLARRAKDGKITPLLPKPADALYFKDGEATRVIRSSPAELPTGSGCDLPVGLLPVQAEEGVAGKPVSGAQYWSLQHLLDWGAGKTLTFDNLQAEGQDSLSIEERTHVALDAKTGASAEGQLFQTGGIDLSSQRQDRGAWDEHDLVFLGHSDVELHDDLANFGGERRLSRFSVAAADAWPVMPSTLEADIRKAGGLRLTFVTPAIFSAGYRPGWLDEALSGSPPGAPQQLKLKLRAAAVERWLPVSGWDLAAGGKGGKPRAVRKAVAAGAVYWFELIGEIPEGFIQSLWLQSLADQEQDRRDGFALALPAPWTPPNTQN